MLLRKLVDGLLEVVPALARRTAQAQLTPLASVLPALAPASAPNQGPVLDEGELREVLVDWFGA